MSDSNNQNRQRVKGSILMLMTFSAVFNFNSIVNNSAAIGLATIPTYIFGSLFYFLPFSLMISEMVTANGASESGVHAWLETTLGPKWAFLGSWAYFFVNLFYFVSLVPATLISLSFLILGKNVFAQADSTIILSILGVIFFWLATYISIKGVSWLSKVTSAAGVARIFLALIFIVLAIILLGSGQAPAQEFSLSSITPKFNWTFFMVMAWVLQAVGGAESIGVYIKDIKGGNKTFVKTMISSTLLVGLIYVLGSIAVGITIPKDVLSGNYSQGMYEMFTILAKNFGLGQAVSVRIVALILFITNVGSLVLWTAAPVKIFFSEIPEGVLGKWIVKTNKEGNPINALILQGVVVSLLLLIPALGVANIDAFLEFVINMTAATSLLPVIFILAAYIYMRVKQDDRKRSYKMGNRLFGIVTGWFLMALFGFVFIMSTVPEPSLFIQANNATLPPGTTNPYFSLLYNVLGVVIFMGIALIAWQRYVRKNPSANQKPNYKEINFN